MNFEKKLNWIRRFLKENNLSAFLFTSFPNIFYLTNFRSSNAFIIITSKEHFFLTDARYFERAKNELKDWEVVLIKENTHSFLKKFIKNLNPKVVGFEKDGITCELREKLKIKGIRFKGFTKVLKKLRIIKDEKELKILKEGIKKTDELYKYILNIIKKTIFDKEEDLTELRLRGFLVARIFEIGAEGESFPAIIASDKNSAIPHWVTSKSNIEKNAPLLIDMGIIWKGYCTDFTRTLHLGKPSSEFKKLYELVKTAWYKGFEKVKRGIPFSEIDKTIREYFKSKDVDKFFVHATGHGIGVEVHEPPRIYYKPLNKEEIIEDGMVFTIEPGLYFPDKFGIRLENIVFVENGKGEIYSQEDLELKVIE